MSTKRYIKSCPRKSRSVSPPGRNLPPPWTVSEERELLQFIVEYNKGKEDWDMGKTMLDKYIRSRRKSGNFTQRTQRGLGARLQMLRRSIRNNIDSEEYGVDLESRKKLADHQPSGAWTVSEERRLVQFVVEYNKGKRDWNTGRKVLGKYIRHLQKSGQPSERTRSGLTFKLHCIRKSIREDLASDKYGMDSESRRKLAAPRQKTQKRNRSSSGYEGRSRARAKSALRDVTPHPVKANRTTKPGHSEAVSSLLQPKITVKFNGHLEPQNVSATAPPGHMELNSGQSAGPSCEAEEEDEMELDTGHGPLMVQIEKSGVVQGPSQLPALAAPVSSLTRIPAGTFGRTPEVGIEGVIGAPIIPTPGSALPENEVMPKKPTEARAATADSATTVITLDDTLEVKMETAAGTENRTRTATPDDFAIVKQLATVPGTTLNEAFTMYLKNKDLYKRLYLELGGT